MDKSRLNKTRFILGIILVVVAVLMLLFGEGGLFTVGAAGIGILGLLNIAVSRRK